jgi:hypothetical protein
LQGRKRAARTRAAQRQRILDLTEENLRLRRKVTKYKVRLHRSSLKTSKSPRGKLRRELKSDYTKISPVVRKKLLFGNALKEDLHETWNAMGSRKERRNFIDKVKFRYVKKYGFMSTTKPFFPVADYHNSRKRSCGAKKKVFLAVKNVVKNFFEQDDVSVQAPGKKDCITQAKEKKQKRYLCNSMKFLHRKFCVENNFVISYLSFCKLKPFWIVSKKVSERDTCVCKQCENMSLLHAALKKEKIFHDDLQSVIEKEICCEKPTVDCYFRKCPACVKKEISVNEFDGERLVHYDAWKAIQEPDTNGKTYRRIVKKRIFCKQHELVDEFFNQLSAYMDHVARIRHQYSTLKNLKSNLTTDDVYLHIDFSENYSCKYNREIQSCHFGGNRLQLTLHTGILYPEKLCFCTITKDLRHDAVAVWSHLAPVLSEYRHAKTIHFVSDSPSAQYQNKSMFHIMFTKIIPMFPDLEEFSWDFSESGHGKGPADGVGGVVKRTCDQMVSLNVQDISNFEEFSACIRQYIKNVRIMDAANRDNDLEKDVAGAKPVKGKMILGQVFFYNKTTAHYLLFLFFSQFFIQ